jgi:hypothetical protein
MPSVRGLFHTELCTFSVGSVLVPLCINNNVFVTEHDDRVDDATRRVSFKPRSNHKGKHRNRRVVLTGRCCVDDDDDMNAPGPSTRNIRKRRLFGVVLMLVLSFEYIVLAFVLWWQ